MTAGKFTHGILLEATEKKYEGKRTGEHINLMYNNKKENF